MEIKRIKDIIQDREDKRLYKIALKEAKQKWKGHISLRWDAEYSD